MGQRADLVTRDAAGGDEHGIQDGVHHDQADESIRADLLRQAVDIDRVGSR